MSKARMFKEAVEYAQKKAEKRLSLNQMNILATDCYSATFDGINHQWTFPDGSVFNLIDNKVFENEVSKC